MAIHLPGNNQAHAIGRSIIVESIVRMLKRYSLYNNKGILHYTQAQAL